MSSISISNPQIMKSIISLIIVSLLNFTFSQSEITFIDYQIEIIDSSTGLKYHNPFIKMDPQFTVKYDSFLEPKSSRKEFIAGAKISKFLLSFQELEKSLVSMSTRNKRFSELKRISP